MKCKQVVNGYMASFPARLEVLRRTLPLAASQVDKLHLVLNEMRTIPDWLDHIKNVVVHLPIEDMKDVGKFFFLIGPVPIGS